MKNEKNVVMILILMCLIIVSLSGCVRLSKPYPIKQYFVLEAKRTGEPSVSSGASIRIKDPEISPLFSSKSFVYKTGDLEFTSDFYNEFFIVPDKMVKSQTQEWLLKSGIFRRISPDPGEKTDYILETSIVNLYLDRTVSPKKAVMEISFFLMPGSKGSDEIIWHANHREEEPIKDDSSSAIAEAWSRALTNTLGFLEKNLGDKVKR